jgi:hypothetical protein
MADTIVIYHGFCEDGFAAAYATWKAAQNKHPELRGNLSFQAAIHETIPPDVTGKKVILVDFCWPTDIMMTMLKQARHVTIIDHHRDAISDMAESSHPNLVTSLRSDISGCMLAWKHFHGDAPPPPLIVKLDQVHMGRDDAENGEDVLAGLRAQPQEFPVWDALDVDRVAADGAAVRRYVALQVEELLRHATTVKFGDHIVPCLNAPTFIYSAEVGERLAKDQPFSVVYWQDKGVYSYSLRSDGIVDVARIAKEHGGGGTRMVAGFRTIRLAHKGLWDGGENDA